jgi:hypothetical protein
MAKTIHTHDYVTSTWESNPSPAEQLTVIKNRHTTKAKGKKFSLTIKA